MKKTALFLTAAIALACAAEPVRLAPSSPEDFTEGERLQMQDGAFAVTKNGTFFTRVRVPIDSSKPGTLTAEYKLLPDATPAQFVIALDSVDAKGVRLLGAHLFGYKSTETVLAADAKKGQRILKIKDADRWQKPAYRRGTMVAFYVKPDSSDLPNRSLSSLIASISPDGEVKLRYPLAASYPAGTPVRIHRDTCSFGIGSVYVKGEEEWKTVTVKILPRRENGDPQCWWPGIAKVGVRFGFVSSKPGAGLLIRNIVFTQEE